METAKCKCGRKGCKGFYLLHPKEIQEGAIQRITNQELKECSNIRFSLDPSPSSGEVFLIFYELHVIETEYDIGKLTITEMSLEERTKRRLRQDAFYQALREVTGCETPV